MPYKLNKSELIAVSKLPAAQRYAHFLKRIADWEEVWLLKTESGYASYGDSAGNQGIGFWPHPDYVKEHVVNGALGTPVSVSISEFNDKWLNGLERDGLKAVIFPTPELNGLLLEPSRVQSDLAEALKDYE